MTCLASLWQSLSDTLPLFVLREIVEAEPSLNSRLDKPFLLSFLRARKFDYDKAMAMVSMAWIEQCLGRSRWEGKTMADCNG